MDDVFISYSRKDKAFAARLLEALKARQRDAWVDLEDIPPTAEWRAKIKAGIEGARAFVFVLSPDSMVSPECQKEVEHAAANHKRRIPIVCREVEAQAVPEALGCLNWIFLREQDDFEKGVDTLLTAVDTDLEWVDAHTNILEKATEWDRKGRDQSLLLRGGELRKAEDWQVKSAEKEPKPTELMASFIVASRQGETSRQRKLLAGVSLALVVAVTLAIVAFFQYRQADLRGKIALSRQLVAQSSNLMGKGRLDLALLLGLAARQVWETPEAKGSLLSALTHERFPLTFLHGHKGMVKTLVYSPDGTIMASGSRDKTIILWDVSTRGPIGSPLIGHTDSVSGMAFSPNGKILATASDDETILLWDLATRKPLGPPLKGHSGKVSTVAFSPDSKLLASGSDKTVILWDVSNFLPLSRRFTTHSNFITNLAFSPDGKLLVSGGGKNIILWDVATVQPLGPPLEGPGFVRGMAFSTDSKTLASAHTSEYGNKVFLWDIAGHKILNQFKAGGLEVWASAAFSSDLRMLASGSNNRTITLWDVKKQRPRVPPLTGHARSVYAVAISPAGRTLASGSSDGSIILWNLSGTQVLGKTISTLQVSTRSDGKKIGISSSVAISPVGKIMAQVNRDKTVYDQDQIKRLLPGVSDEEDLSEIISSQANKPLAVEKDPSVTLRDLTTGRPLGPPLPGLNGAQELSEVIFSPDGKLLATAKDWTNILVWDVATQKLLKPPLPDNGTRVWSLAFSPDSRLLASGQNDNKIVLWEIPNLKPWGAPFLGHADMIFSLAFSPDGTTLASGGGLGTIIFWDVATRRPLGPPLKNHSMLVTSLAFSPDGRILASANWDQTIILWDVTKRRPLGPPLAAHETWVNAVRFSPDGKTLASADNDGSIILWDVDTCMPLGAPLKSEGFVYYLYFSSDGKTLTSTGSYLTIQWDVDPEVWKSRACSMANRNLTREEWRRYLGDVPYRKTCPNLPVPEE